MSIRKFKKDKLGIRDLVGFGAFSEQMAMYLGPLSSFRAVRVLVKRQPHNSERDGDTILQAMNISKKTWSPWRGYLDRH